MKRYDVIVVGAGHNGLVLATYLAKAGLNVLILERNAKAGGSLNNYEIIPGFVGSCGPHTITGFSAQVARELRLHKYGLEFIPLSGDTTLLPNGDSLTSFRSARFNCEEIARHSKNDAERYTEFSLELRRQSHILRPFFRSLTPSDGTRAGRKNMQAPQELLEIFDGLDEVGSYQIARLFFESCSAYLGACFESDIVKAHIGAPRFFGSTKGPLSPGTASLLLNPNIETSGGGVAGLVRGGVSRFVTALERSLVDHGGEVLFESEVTDINLEDKKAVGVTLADGSTISSRLVVSNLDPKRTYLTLFDWKTLPQPFVKRIGNYRMRGVLAKMDIALDRLPKFLSLSEDDPAYQGRLYFTDNLLDLEQAFDDWKEGIVPANPPLEIIIPSSIDRSLAPSGKHVMSVYVQYVPSRLFDGIWDAEKRQQLARAVIDQLSAQCPDLEASILDWSVSTSEDFERKFALTDGDIHHGEMSLDQMLFNRPIPELADGLGPIENFFLCGAGTQSGGGVTGIPGAITAHRIIGQSERWRDV